MTRALSIEIVSAGHCPSCRLCWPLTVVSFPLCPVSVKPENLIFANKTEDSDLLIADFGLSRITSEDTFKMLTTTCGTPGVRRVSVLTASYGV